MLTRKQSRRGRRRMFQPQLEQLEDRRVLATMMVTHMGDGPVNGPGDLPGSLRQAIYDANQTTGPDQIIWQAGVTGTLTLTNGELQITDDVTISGAGHDQMTIDAAGNSRVFNIDDGNSASVLDVELRDMSITGGRVTGNGGGIHSQENLTIYNSQVFGNEVFSGDGGGIFNQWGDLVLDGSTVRNNAARSGEGEGGGLFTRDGDLFVIDSVVSDNRTYGTQAEGGGILSRAGSLTITRSSVTGNATLGEGSDGGGIFARDGLLTVEDSVVSDNFTVGGSSLSAPGGGIFTYSQLVMTNSTMSGNHTTARGGRGGAIFASGVLSNITDCTFDNNYTQGDVGHGGAIYSRDGATHLLRTTITGSSTIGAPAQGGAIFSQDGLLTLTDSNLSGNSTSGIGSKGGAIMVQRDDLTVDGSVIADNRTTNGSASGGGIYSRHGDVTVMNTTISGNETLGTSDSYGGGIALNTNLIGTETALIKNSTVSGNSTRRFGGGIFNIDGQTIIENSTVTANSAPSGNGSGVFSYGNPAARTELTSTIVAGNVNSDVDFVRLSGTAVNTFVSHGYNLIGNGNALAAFTSNDLTNVANAMLGPLADNGGPTFTHALLAGSPAIDAGDPAAVAGVGDTPEFDQRGMPYGRVEDGDRDMVARIDIGAFELQPVTPIDGDFNDDGFYDLLDIDALVGVIAAGSNDIAYDLTGDGLVDLADRDAWLAEAAVANGLGSPYKLGDADLNGIVDGIDFIAWNAHKFTNVALWSAADFTANGTVDGLDFIEWNANKFTSSDSMVLPRPTAVSSAADESSSDVLRTGSTEQVPQDNLNASLVIQHVSKGTETDGTLARRMRGRHHGKRTDRQDLLHAAAFASWADHDTAWGEQLRL